jgi:hypothetical protein
MVQPIAYAGATYAGVRLGWTGGGSAKEELCRQELRIRDVGMAKSAFMTT